MILVFLRWWFDQLVGLVPSRIRERLRRPPDAILLDGASETLSVSVRRRGIERPLGRIGGRGVVPPRRAALPSLILLRPTLDMVLRKQLRLPAAALGHLKRALGYEMERETPFTAEDLHWDYRVLRHD